jgi:hypothetical protein
LDKITITPRTVQKSKIDKIHVLKYLSWTLNINLNLISITRVFNTHHKQPFVLRYIFQNTLVKLLRFPHTFTPISVVVFKHQYYVLTKTQIFPILSNITPHQKISFNGVLVTVADILQIVRSTNIIKFPFNISVFTSYSYLRSLKNIDNIIGQYLCPDSSDTLNILLTPHIRSSFLNVISLLTNITYDKKFNLNSLFVNSYKQEGEKTIYTPITKETTLNQSHCICDNPDTQFFKPPRNYKNLGKICFSLHNLVLNFIYVCVFAASHQLQKFFLYENLGKYTQNTANFIFCIL